MSNNEELKKFMSDRFDDLSTQFRNLKEHVDDRFDTLNVRMDGVDARLRDIKTRFDNLPCNKGEGCVGCK